MNITLKQIRAFLAVARLGSFTRASAQMHSTQSSLSVLVRELETELDTRLLDRTTRKVEVTEAGREFIPFAERIVAELEHAVSSTSELVAKRRGRVTVAAPPLAAAAFLPRAIARFRDLYPGITVVLEDIRPDQIAARVAGGQFDCGVGVFDTEEDELTSFPLLHERLMLACPSGHPLARKKQVAWKDLAGHPMIAITPDSAVRRRLDRHMELAGIAMRPAFEVRQMITMLGMVDARLGIAVWPSWASSVVRLYDIEVRPLIKPKVVHVVSAVTPKGRALSPAAESFLNSLGDYARSLSPPRHSSSKPISL